MKRVTDLYNWNTNTDELCSFQPKPNKTDKDRNLANAVASKLEDGNFKAALRLICSDDTPVPDNQDTFQALLDEHPQAPEDRNHFRIQKNLQCSLHFRQPSRTLAKLYDHSLWVHQLVLMVSVLNT